jgi:spore maturation protein B
MAEYGADSLIGNIVSTMQGSTETTFYVLALYFGVARIKDSRHALPACLLADIAGALGAVWACHLLLS